MTETVPQSSEIVTSRQRRNWKFRSIGSRCVMLILLWEFLFSCTLGFQLLKVYQLRAKIEWGYYMGLAIFCCLLPTASLLAEVITSRYKLVRFSIKVSWLFAVIDCIILVIGDYFTNQNVVHTIFKTSLILLIPQTTLHGAFLVSAVPLGIDQIIDGSSSEISSFILWLVWSMNSGVGIMLVGQAFLYSCTSLESSVVNMILSLVLVVLFSVGLILDIFLSHKLVHEPVTVNPITLIYKVLKYAAKHRSPVSRSAFTYCEDELPSRLDNGKLKYGGPFTTEQVEDVKTFWRIILVIFVVSLLCLSAAPQLIATQTAFVSTAQNCMNDVLSEVRGILPASMIMIPLYELLVYPCLRNRGPRILHSVGIGAAALILSILYGLIAEMIQYFLSNGTMQCLFKENISCIISYIPYTFILGFSLTVFPKCSIEFVCAQAPYNMRGLLVGLLFALLATFILCGALIYELWEQYILTLDNSRYGIWFYLTTLILAMASSVPLVCVIRWYKERERDDINSSQNMVEEIYYKYQEQEDRVTNRCT